MPRQNRVTPYGNLIATPARGTLMGNRGVLHDAQGQIRHHYRGKRWIICRLSFKGRQRQVMAPGHYTELFFLDEATALAAGHRPCAECTRPRFYQFRQVWAAANPRLAGGPKPLVDVIDAALHRERLSDPRTKRKVTFVDRLETLPAGVFVSLAPNDTPYLVLEDHLLPWRPEGYGPPLDRPADCAVQVLTPRSVVQMFAQGFVPGLHSSATQ